MEEDSAMAAAAAAAEEASRRRPRDLLRRFGSVSSCYEESANGADSDEIELSLGLSLSLGGCFGSDPNPNSKGKTKLLRSSSLASFSPFSGDSDFSSAAAAACPLARTCSLPTETEEERRKRKKMESLKRLEAKRKRLSRRNSLKFAAPGRERFDCFPPISQGSIGSQGSSSFTAAVFEIKSAAEGNDGPLKVQPLPDNINHRIAAMPPTAPTRTAMNCDIGQQSPVRTLSGRTNSLGKNIMEDMPCVSTKGDGPNGRRIEGFLFKFEKVEDVRIVCVCHGSFLTPAEFVKHAGGGDVAHPLKHIVVNPPPPSFS